MIQRSHHDMGGLPGGKVERGALDETHDYAEWERRVDALAVLLQGIKKGTKRLVTVDERRKAIEMLPPEEYDRMSYYERWVISLAQALIQRGIVTSEEIARKMLEVQKRA
jgi:nitrile hydratase subunit beta